MRPLRIALLVALASACALGPEETESQAPLGASSAFDPGPLEIGEHSFARRVLPNGLRALAAREGGDGTVSVFVVYAVGSGVESPASTGLAHLVEHAMYAGTARTPAGEHDAIVGKLGGESNAYTRQDYTLYYDHEIPAKHLDTVLALEADRMRGLTFEREAVLHERYRLEVEERRTFSGDVAIQELLESAVFRAHPYAAGVRDGVHTRAPKLSVDEVRAFYDTWYHPGNAALVVVGDADPNVVLNSIARAFGGVPAGPVQPEMPVEPRTAAGGEVRFASELLRERVVHAWLGPAASEVDVGPHPRLALELLARVLNARVEDNDLSAGMGGRFGRDLFTLSATGEGAQERLVGLHETVADLVDADSVERARQSAAGELTSLELRARPYFSLAAQVAVWAAHGREGELAARVIVLDALGVDDVLAAADEWLDPERRWSVRFLPGGGAPSELPEDPQELRELAERADASGDFALAVAAYERLLAGGPNRMNTVIYLYTLGDLRQRSGDIDGAIADLERALDVVDYPAVRELRDELLERRDGGERALGVADAAEPEPEQPATPAQPERPASGRGVTYSEELAPELAEEALRLMAWIEEWRGLPFLADLHVDVVGPEEAEEKLRGWYEPDTDRLVVVDDEGGSYARGTLLHEMVHALQDQHFDLEALHHGVEGDAAGRSDAERALQALIEGEAMLAVSELMDYDFEQHAHIPTEGELDEDRFQKVFHYGAGLRYVRALRDAGGWPQVDAAWGEPPTTTAAILHPDRALVGWSSGAPFVEEGVSRGEYGLALELARDVRTRPQAMALAGRWASDTVTETEWRIRVHDAIAADRLRAAFESLDRAVDVEADGVTLRLPAGTSD